MGFENWEPQGPSKNETRIAIAIVGILALVIPITIVGGFIHYRNAGKKPEANSLEAAIRSVGTKIVEVEDCDNGVNGYYLFQRNGSRVTRDEVGVCVNNFSKTLNDSYHASMPGFNNLLS